MKTFGGALASAVVLSGAAHAAGLGKLTVLSALGQPLRAEIELTGVAGEEADALVAKLAPSDAFRLANIDFNPALLSLRFAVEQRNGRPLIRVSSGQPVNEPFVDLLLELSWNSGRLVREYTFLLDPLEMRQAQPAQVAAPGEAQPQSVAPAQPEGRFERALRSASETPREPREARAPRAAKAAAGGADYRIRRGDTLSKIAARLKPADVSLDAMLVALYRANPDAFVGNNMNRLRAGQILTLPDPDALSALAEGDGEAHGVVVAHAADFSAYRHKLASQVARGTPAKPARSNEAGQSAAGKIAARVEERATPANAAQDRLKLSKANPAAPGAGPTAVAGVEDKIAKERQIADAAARVKELEKNVSDLEKLLAVKSKTGAELAVAPKEAPKPAAPAPAAATPALPAAATPAASAAPEAAPAPKPKPKVKPAAPKPPPEPSLLDVVSDNLGALGAALGVLLAGAGALLLARRKKKQAPPAAAAPEPEAPSLFAEPGGQSIDTNNSVFNSNFAPSASQLDTNEVDPVAEADVYIAYGRDAQAEEILKEALRTHPERAAVRLKLLEIYAARKDVRSFETQASEFYSMTKGQGEEWQQAAALGLSIDPLNPLYAGPAAAPQPEPEPVEDFLAQVAPPASFDFEPEPAPPAPEPAPAPAPAAAAPVAPADPDNFLDFDLGGLNFEPAGSAPEIPAPVPAAAAEPSFDMTFDLPDEPAKPAAPASAAAPPPDPLADLDLMDFDLPATAAAPAPAAPEAPAKAAAEFDLADIDLDLGAAEAAAPQAEVDDGKSAAYMEMETKLDLAVAYQEIGDKEGARELIDEVIKDGAEDQVAKAVGMRAALG